MDQRSARVLQSIGRSIPKQLINSLMVKKDLKAGIRANMIGKLEEARKRGKIGKAEYEKGMQYARTQVQIVEEVNPEVEKKIDKFVTDKVKDAIRSGDVRDPEKVVNEEERRRDAGAL